MSVTSPTITWEKLPNDYILPDDPVDNIHQPTIASSLTDILTSAGLLSDTSLTTTNYGICATLDGQMVVKAPDWSYIRQITVPIKEVDRSYTPHLQGEIPLIVMEFLSETDGEEYSTKSTYPPGKWFFYEQVLRVPTYVIFEPISGDMEVYRLNELGRYQRHPRTANNRYWIPELNLELGEWYGRRATRTGYWLRLWDAAGNLLLWGEELARQEADRATQAQLEATQAQLEAEQERDRATQAQLEATQAQVEAERERDRATQAQAEAEQAQLEAERAQLEAERERDRAIQAQAEVDRERDRAEKLAEQLRALGIDPIV